MSMCEAAIRCPFLHAPAALCLTSHLLFWPGQDPSKEALEGCMIRTAHAGALRLRNDIESITDEMFVPYMLLKM